MLPKINVDKLEIIERFDSRTQRLEILAEYSESEEQSSIIGGLYLNQDWDESESLDYIPDDDDPAMEQGSEQSSPFIRLQLIEVLPEYRGAGIATALMDYFFENELWLKFTERNTYIFLDVHPQGLGITKEILRAFYSKYGFEPSGGNYMIKYLD